VDRIRAPSNALTDFMPAITGLEHPVYLKVFAVQFPFEQLKIQGGAVTVFGIRRVAEQGIPPESFEPVHGNVDREVPMGGRIFQPVGLSSRGPVDPIAGVRPEVLPVSPPQMLDCDIGQF